MPYMFLNGGGMRGGSLHHRLRDAPLVAETRTAPLYRFYSCGDRYPALQFTADGQGAPSRARSTTCRSTCSAMSSCPPNRPSSSSG